MVGFRRYLRNRLYVAAGCLLLFVATGAYAQTVIELAEFGTWSTPVFEAIIEEFERENPDIRVRVTSTPFPQHHDRLLVRMAGRDAPDVALSIQAFFINFAARGALTPITPLLEEVTGDSEAVLNRFLPAPLNAFTSDGVLYGLPLTDNPIAIVYNEELFREAGVPTPYEQSQAGEWTWDAFLETAKQMTRREGRDQVWGFANEWDPWDVIMRIWQNGGELWNEDKTESLIDQPAAYEAIQWFFDLHLVHGVAPDFASAQSNEFNLFPTGRVAMIDAGPSTTLTAFRDLPFSWGVAPQPRGVREAHWGGGGGLVIPRNARNPEAAMRFIEFATSQRGQAIMLANGGPFGTLHGEIIEATPEFQELFEQEPPLNPEVWLNAQQSSFPPPWIARNPEFLAVFNEQLDLVAIGRITAEEATRRIKEEADRLVQP